MHLVSHILFIECLMLTLVWHVCLSFLILVTNVGTLYDIQLHPNCRCGKSVVMSVTDTLIRYGQKHRVRQWHAM